MLDDTAAIVATEAGRLLAASEDPRVDGALIERIESAGSPRADRAVAALGRRGTPAATEALENLAGRWPATGRHRTLKKLARRALEANRG